MTIASEIQRIQTNIANAYDALEAKGATMPATENTDNLAATIETISSGGGGDIVTVLNSTGSSLSNGDKVYIAANTNLKALSRSVWAPSVGWTGVAKESIANGSSGSVSTIMSPPATGLSQYSRVGGISTVVGFFTDGNGTKYAVCVLDAQYRKVAYWSGSFTTTGNPYYNSQSGALAATESATANMDTILNLQNLGGYPAFNYAHGLSVEYNGQTFYGLIPNAAELLMIYNDRYNLDSYDTTLGDYSSNRLATWNITGNNAVWSSTEDSSTYAWQLLNSNDWSNFIKDRNSGVVPIFEIPIDN